MFPRKLTKAVISDPDYPVVKTTEGLLRGLVVEDTFIFRGIQYAQAKRFCMPERVTPWQGVREATVFGPTCLEISTLMPPDKFLDPHLVYPQSENCQYLNIWTQSIDPEAKRPVMVWLHGGGFQHGSSLEILAYDGFDLSKFGDVVVVSLNHRLHALGYMDLSDYGEKYKYTGNLGTADMVMALQWIHDNIAAFGGDPERVMLFGQSGGGMKTHMLLQVPAADGLYHAISMQSAGSGKDDQQHETAAQIADCVVQELGLTKETIEQIETVPFHEFAMAISKVREKYGAAGKMVDWLPVADKDYYMGSGYRVGYRKETLHVPILIGTVLGEMVANPVDNLTWLNCAKPDWDAEKIHYYLHRRFGDNYDEICAAYQKAYPERPPIDAAFTDVHLRDHHIKVAQDRAATVGAAPVYNWVFSLELPAYGGSTAWHNAEEPFVFHNQQYYESMYIPEVTDRLADIMSTAWIKFAETGNPNHSGMPCWEPCGTEEMATMLFDRECRMVHDHDKEFISLVKKVQPRRTDRGPVVTYGGGPRAGR